MIVRKSVISILFILLCCIGAAAGQRNGFNVIEFPITLANSSDVLYVGWFGLGMPPSYPNTTTIYFSRNPGGGDLRNYRNSVKALPNGSNLTRDGALEFVLNHHLLLPIMGQPRGTFFRPDSSNMTPGTYYCIVAAVVNSDTLYSNEFTIMVDAPTAPKPIGPSGNNITNLTPTFTWERPKNADVPYYHVILSDEPLPLDLSDPEDPKITGDMSIVWQAITPRTSITYGEPDPSGFITASPPPLSPGKEYSWIVFSNFGNHIAFSSNKLSLPQPFLKFTVAGEPLKKPRNVSVNSIPAGNNPVFHPAPDSIVFRWTDLDTNANTYLVNLFVAAKPKDIVQGFGDDLDFSGSLLVWETTVARGDKKDMLEVKLDAKNTLTGGSYKWRVFALDSRGAGTAGDPSDFEYHVPVNHLVIHTKEVISGDTVKVGMVELRSEVLSGPMEKALVFQTDIDGFLARERPIGSTYRITAVKDGFKTETRTVTVNPQGTNITIFMERPRAAIFGRVTDSSDIPLNLASVIGVSEWGDTVRTLTNGGGNFSLSCSDADWTVTVEMAGYRSSSPRKITLKENESHKFDIKLGRNPIILSGSVRNSAGTPIIGTRVRILRDGILIDELASTSQEGTFSFSLAAGVYTLTAEKPGFTTYSAAVTVTGSRTQNITLRQGVLVNGVVMGRSWSEGESIFAPVPSAIIKFWETDSKDTVTAVSDAVFGNFSAGLENGKIFNYASSAAGFTTGKDIANIRIQSNQTYNVTDTIYGLAMISGETRDAGRNIGGVDIVIFDKGSNRVAASGRSSANGSFEIRNIPDGDFSVNAAMTGYFLVGGAREFKVRNGKPTVDIEGVETVLPSYVFVLEAGERKISWDVKDRDGARIKDSSTTIKIISPFMRALAFGAALDKAGPGDYIIEAEAADTLLNLLNLSYYKFTVGEKDTTMSFSLPFTHVRQNTVELNHTFKINSGNAGSSRAVFFYRSEGRAEFRSVERTPDGDNSYSFTFPANARPRDGSDLYYYFQVYTADGKVYGSQKQIYRSYIAPNPKAISRIEIVPGVSDGDTLLLPSSYSAQFSFRAFYSSSFIPLDSASMESLRSSIRWNLEGSADCRLEGGSGLNVTLRTLSSSSESKAVLTAKFNAPSGFEFSGSDSIRVPFKISGSALESISILRTDSKAPEAITNAEEAAFRVVAVDKKGNAVTVSPQWTIEPDGRAGRAGVISSDGKFTPNRRYVGNVRVMAAAGGMKVEFNPVDRANKVTTPGLMVTYMLRSGRADTVSNLKGLRLAFADKSIAEGEMEQFEVSTLDMKNEMKRSGGGFRVADSVVFDIVPRGGNAKLNFGSSGSDSSITIIIEIPSRFREEVKKSRDAGDQNFHIAWWNPKRLRWQITNDDEGKDSIRSVPSSDGSTLSAVVSHFSEYAVVMTPKGFDVSLNISPNPFSPFIMPVREYGENARVNNKTGTCIKVGITAPGQRVASVKVHIYNAVGHRVWAVERLNAAAIEQEFWWNGRTLKREEVWGEHESVENFNERIKNNPMARNGRYFVTVIVKNTDGKTKRVMKPVVLMK